MMAEGEIKEREGGGGRGRELKDYWGKGGVEEVCE